MGVSAVARAGAGVGDLQNRRWAPEVCEALSLLSWCIGSMEALEASEALEALAAWLWNIESIRSIGSCWFFHTALEATSEARCRTYTPPGSPGGLRRQN